MPIVLSFKSTIIINRKPKKFPKCLKQLLGKAHIGESFVLNFYFTDSLLLWDHSFSTFAKFLRKTKISSTLKRACTCAYKGVRNDSLTENLTNILNE